MKHQSAGNIGSLRLGKAGLLMAAFALAASSSALAETTAQPVAPSAAPTAKPVAKPASKKTEAVPSAAHAPAKQETAASSEAKATEPAKPAAKEEESKDAKDSKDSKESSDVKGSKEAKESAEKPTAAPTAAKQEEATAVVKAGDMEISHISMAQKGGKIDLFFTVKNEGKSEETLSGAEAKWESANVVMISKQKDGSFVEAPIRQIIAAGETEKFEPGEKWLRIKGSATPKESDALPIWIYFRRSPNANLVVVPKQMAASSSKTLDVTAKPPEPKTATEAAPAAKATEAAAPAASGSSAAPSTAAPEDKKAAPGLGQSFLNWFRK